MAIDYSRLALSKGKPRRRVKARAQRAETKVKRAVRAACVERDGECALGIAFFGHRGWPREIHDETGQINGWTEGCEGRPEWAHMHAKRRSKTLGMAPEERHDTAHSLMLCKRHHDQYDGRERPRLHITAFTRRGADGPLKFRRAK